MSCGYGILENTCSDDGCSDDATTNNHPLAKVCWYLPIIPRFKRLFANADDAKNLTWHADSRKNYGFLRNPANSQWKTIDQLYPNFGQDPKNLRLGLAFDGMNPFGNLSSSRSSWPVLLIQPSSLVVHQAKIHYVVYDDSRSKIARK